MTLLSPIFRLGKKIKGLKGIFSRDRPEPGRSEVGGRRVGPTDSHLQPKTYARVIEEGRNVDPVTGEVEDDSIDQDRGGVRRGKNQRNAMRSGREDLKPSASESERNEVGRGRVESANSDKEQKPHVVQSGNLSPRDGEPDDDSINPDLVGVPRGKGPQDVMDDSGEEWKSTTAATAKLLFRTVGVFADAFPPLGSVVKCLSSILGQYEQSQDNKQAVESLVPRVKSLVMSLGAPIYEDDPREELRRTTLGQILENVRENLAKLQNQGNIKGFFVGVENAKKLGSLVGEIQDAIVEYQISLQQDIYYNSRHLIESDELTRLNNMDHVDDAAFDCGDLEREVCLRGTRTGVLQDIESWLSSPPKSNNHEIIEGSSDGPVVDKSVQNLFWLKGHAGTGKSTIARTFAKTAYADRKLGASFFCSRDYEDRRDIQKIFMTLAFQLAYRFPEFRKKVLPVLKANPGIGKQSLRTQLELLIIRPFEETRIRTLIIIDALDECKDGKSTSAILFALSEFVERIPLVKFFITGRSESQIRLGFKLLQSTTKELELHEVKRSLVDADIKLFLETRLTEIAKTREDCTFPDDWPSSSSIEFLCERSDGLFIYASTVVNFIASLDHVPKERLAQIISLSKPAADNEESAVDSLYAQVLEQAFPGENPGAQEIESRFKLVVGAVLLVFHPLSKQTFLELLGGYTTQDRFTLTLDHLHSLLFVPESEDQPIRAFHKSFPDFLTDSQRCENPRFFLDPPLRHIEILFSCLNLMKEKLKKNICGLDGCPPLSEFEELRKPCIGRALEYACRYWTGHLLQIPNKDGTVVKDIKAAIKEFFKTRLLFWIEVLSLTKHLDRGVHAIRDIDKWYLLTADSCKWTTDSQRLILSSFESIRDFPTDVYRHVLPFCPSSSWLHKSYTPESLGEVKVVKGRPDIWGTCDREVSFCRTPEALAHWKDIIIAVGLESGKIDIIDAITGTTRSALSGHEKGVMSLAFSQDGALLVSGSVDNTVKLWDVQIGRVVKTFHDLADSVSISSDATIIASASTDSVKLWSIRMDKCDPIHTISAPGGVTYLHLFSTVPGRLVFISNGLVQHWDIGEPKANDPVQRWDVRRCGTGSTSPGCTNSGHHIAFSSDEKRFVLCGNGPPTVHNTASGAITNTLLSPGRHFTLCCFSPTDQFVAGAANSTIYVWNVTGDPHLVKTFPPHSSTIDSLIYPLSLTSMHRDGKIRFQRIDDDSLPDQTPENTKSTGPSPAKIVRITLQTEEGIAVSVDSVGTIERWDLSTGHPEILLHAAENERVIGARLVDRKLIIVHSLSNGWGVFTWDVEAGERLKPIALSGDLSILDATTDLELGISKDGSTFFVVDSVNIQTWSTSTGESTGTIFHRDRTRTSISVVLDGTTIWIRALGRSQAWGWDLRDIELPPLDSSKIPHRLRLAYVDGARGSDDKSKIMDATSQTEVFRLPGKFACPGKVVWDGRYLFAIYDDEKLLILDFASMKKLELCNDPPA